MEKPVVRAFVLLSAFMAACVSEAQLRFASAITDHAVLQRDVACPIWGIARPGAKVRVVSSVGGKADAIADADGRWIAKLPPHAALARPFTVTAESDGEKAVISDLLYGDVWYGSGQSNMSVTFDGYGRRVIGFDDLPKIGNQPMVRLLYVPQSVSYVPEKEIFWPETWDKDRRGWTRCTPETARRFGAAQFFFGIKLQKALGVPVGLVNAAYPGVKIDTWNDFINGMDLAKRDSDFSRSYAMGVSRWCEGVWKYWVADGNRERYPEAIRKWREKNAPLELLEKGEFRMPEFDDSGWMKMTLPFTFTGSPWIKGRPNTTYIRVPVDLTAEQVKQGWAIRVGDGKLKIRKESTYLNGVCCGVSGSPRHGYGLNSKAMREGRNVIFFSVESSGEDNDGWSGSAPSIAIWRNGPVESSRIVLTNATVFVSASDPKNPRPANYGREACNALRAGSCHNSMNEPLYPMAIRGVLWYQGCSDVGNESWYTSLFQNRVDSWRRRFTHAGTLPVIATEIAPHNLGTKPTSREKIKQGLVDKSPVWSVSASWRAYITKLANSIPDCSSIPLNDGGEDDIHPINKELVGERWFRQAMKRAYGRDIGEDDGPTVEGVEWRGGEAIIHLTHAKGLKTSDGKPVKGFELAGPPSDELDEKGQPKKNRDGSVKKRYDFVYADAKIDGETVTLSAPGISEASALRYAFFDLNVGWNLVNGAGYPARTMSETKP